MMLMMSNDWAWRDLSRLLGGDVLSPKQEVTPQREEPVFFVNGRLERIVSYTVGWQE